MMMIKTTTLAVAALALLLLASAPAANARRLVWRGGNTNFNNPENWENNAFPEMGSSTGEVDLRSDTSYTTVVGAATYDVGKKIKFPENGRIIFDGSDAVRFKFDGEAEGPAATFLGPRETAEYDFNCPSNWRAYRTGTIGDAVVEPPREGDDVLFPSENSYFIFSQVPLTNVDSFLIGEDFTQAKEFESCTAFPENQFSGIDCDTFYINNGEACVGEFSIVNDDGIAECMWYNSCPTPEEDRAQDERIQAAIEREADRIINLQMESVTRDFSFVVPASHFATDEVIAALGASNPDYLSVVVMRVEDILNESNLWNVTDLAISAAADDWTITGTVMSQRVLVFGSDVDLTSEDPAQFPDDADASFFVNMLTKIAYVTNSLFVDDAQTSLDDTITTVCGEDDAPLVMQAVEAVHAIADYLDGPTAALDLIENVCANFACGDNSSVLFAALSDELEDVDITMQEIEMIAELIANVDNVACVADLFDDAQFQEDIEDLDDAQDMADARTPVDTEFESIAIPFGRSLPTTTLRILLNGNNYDDFVSAVVSRLAALGFADVISDVRLILAPTSNRRATGEYQIEAIITYIVSCITDQTCSNHIITPDSGLYTTIVNAMNGIAASHTFQVHECFVDGLGNYLTFPDTTCLERLAVVALANNGGNRRDAHDELYADVECGAVGRSSVEDGNGEFPCYFDPADPDRLDQAVWDALDSGTVSPEASTSSVPLPAVAGAAGGALLIIVIIVIIVLKRRGGSGPAQPKPAKASKKDAIDSRNVVAFENPMYEDNTTTAYADDAIYNEMEEDAEGLYDEPAFNGAARENPLYESTGDLTAMDDDIGATDEGGYLDVAADTGYLDVNAEEEADE